MKNTRGNLPESGKSADIEARARKLMREHDDDYAGLGPAIAAALRAERERALEDAEMAVSGYVAIAAGPKHVEGLRKLFRALKERSPKRDP